MCWRELGDLTDIKYIFLKINKSCFFSFFKSFTSHSHLYYTKKINNKIWFLYNLDDIKFLKGLKLRIIMMTIMSMSMSSSFRLFCFYIWNWACATWFWTCFRYWITIVCRTQKTSRFFILPIDFICRLISFIRFIKFST